MADYRFLSAIPSTLARDAADPNLVAERIIRR